MLELLKPLKSLDLVEVLEAWKYEPVAGSYSRLIYFCITQGQTPNPTPQTPHPYPGIRRREQRGSLERLRRRGRARLRTHGPAAGRLAGGGARGAGAPALLEAPSRKRPRTLSNQKTGFRNPKPKIRNPRLEVPKPEILKPKPGARRLKPGTQYPEPEA